MSKVIYIKTLSPVFIGSDYNLEPFEYYYDDIEKRIYRLDVNKTFNLILDKHPDVSSKLSNWINEITEKIRSEKDNQKQSRIRAKFTIPEFVKTQLQDHELSEQILNYIKNKNIISYSIPCHTMSGLHVISDKNKKRTQMKKTISVALKTANHQLYIPGSSLKGVCRTALLFYYIYEADNHRLEKIKSIVNKALHSKDNKRGKKYWAKHFCDRLEYEIFNCGYSTDKGIQYHDAKYDLLKLISITDTDTKKVAEAGCIAAVDVYQANGDIQPQTPAVEAIIAEQIFQSRINVDTNFIFRAKQLLDNNDAYFGKTTWIGFKDKFENLFGVSLNELDTLSHEKLEQKIIQRILNAVQLHGRMIAQRDKDWAKRVKNDDLISFFDSLNGLSATKLGYASSFLGTTVFLAMNANKQLRPLLEKILKTFQIGKPPKSQSFKGVNLDRFPTSRRMQTVLNGVAKSVPLGWIVLSLESPPDRPIQNKIAGEKEEVQVQQPPGTVTAEIIDTNTKPPRVQILEGEYKGEITILPGVRLENLRLGKGSKIYVRLLKEKTKLIKADFVRKANL